MKELMQCVASGSAGEADELLPRMSDDDVEALAVDLIAHEHATHTWLLKTVEELETRQIPQRSHVITTRQWVRAFCRVTKAKAGRLFKDAVGLRALPNVSKRATAGEIPAESVSMLVAVASEFPEEFRLFEEVFADIATTLDPSDLRKAVELWRQQVDHPGVLDEVSARRNRRCMSLNKTFDGMWRHDGLYDPESGHIVAQAVHAHVDAGNLDPEDRRSYSQRLVDGLVDVCRFYLDHNSDFATSGGEKPHVTVMLDYDQLLAGAMDEVIVDQVDAVNADSPAEISSASERRVASQRHTPRSNPLLPEIDGTPITFETMRRLVCDSGVVRIVSDAEGLPLDVGRKTRTIPSAIRRALDLRDQGCRWRGCDAPLGWTDAHHVRHWALGGDTSLKNLMLLCRKHHTAIHDPGIRAQLDSRPIVAGYTPRPEP